MAVKWAPSPLTGGGIAFRVTAPMLHANSWAGIRHFISFQTSYAGNGLNNCFVVTKAS